mgnify:CR=1 FL=1|jgi:hypothetical protein
MEIQTDAEPKKRAGHAKLTQTINDFERKVETGYRNSECQTMKITYNEENN